MANRPTTGNPADIALTTADEDFPVVPWLIPAYTRRHIVTFYRFVRHADDIADAPSLPPGDKLPRLDALEEVLRGRRPSDRTTQIAAELRDSFIESRVGLHHAFDLLKAFRKDAANERYRTWDDLIDYCRLAAMPVGRYLLDLHGENDEEACNDSDALCTALQILNQLRDCKTDYRTLNRIYMPLEWMEEMKVRPESLGGASARGQVRLLFDRVLDGVEHLLIEAKRLPKHIEHRGLLLQATILHLYGGRLHDKLRSHDPLDEYVHLNVLDRAWCGLRGLIKRLPGL